MRTESQVWERIFWLSSLDFVQFFEEFSYFCHHVLPKRDKVSFISFTAEVFGQLPLGLIYTDQPQH